MHGPEDFVELCVSICMLMLALACVVGIIDGVT